MISLWLLYVSQQKAAIKSTGASRLAKADVRGTGKFPRAVLLKIAESQVQPPPTGSRRRVLVNAFVAVFLYAFIPVSLRIRTILIAFSVRIDNLIIHNMIFIIVDITI